MSYLLVFETQAHQEVQKLIVDGLLPIKDSLPLSAIALKDGQFLMLDNLTSLVVIDRSVVVSPTPYEEKKHPEIEVVTYVGKHRETIIARKYTRNVCTKVPKVEGVTIKGRPFTTYNCSTIALEIT